MKKISIKLILLAGVLASFTINYTIPSATDNRTGEGRVGFNEITSLPQTVFQIYHDVVGVQNPIEIPNVEQGFAPTNAQIDAALRAVDWYRFVAYSDVGGAQYEWQNSHWLGSDWIDRATGETIDFSQAATTSRVVRFFDDLLFRQAHAQASPRIVANTLEIIYHTVVFVDPMTALLGNIDVPHGSYFDSIPIHHPEYIYPAGYEDGGWWQGVFVAPSGQELAYARNIALNAPVPDAVSRATTTHFTPGGRPAADYVVRNTTTDTTRIPLLRQNAPTAYSKVRQEANVFRTMNLANISSIDRIPGQSEGQFQFDGVHATPTAVTQPQILARSRLTLTTANNGNKTGSGVEEKNAGTSEVTPPTIGPRGNLPTAGGVASIGLSLLGALIVTKVVIAYKKRQSTNIK